MRPWAMLVVLLLAAPARAFVLAEDELEETSTELGFMVRGFTFTLTGPTPGTRDDLEDGGCHTFGDLLPGFYTISETIQSGYSTTVDCGDRGSDDDGEG